MAVLTALFCCSCGSYINSRDDLTGKRIGVLDDSSSEPYAKLYGSVKSFQDKKTLVNALKLGEVECLVVDSRSVKDITRFSFLKKLKESLAESHLKIAVAKENPDLVDDINRAISYLSDEGILKEIIKAHYSGQTYHSSYSDDGNDSHVLTVALGGDFGPFKYYDEEGNIAGIDVDIAREICAYLGLRVAFIEVSGSRLVGSVAKGEAHFALGGITTDSVQNDECLLTNEYDICTQIIVTK